jgi:hypothetical protein
MRKTISLMALILTGFMFSGTTVKHHIETTKKPLDTVIAYKKP